MASVFSIKIAGGEVPTEFLYQDENLVAFKILTPGTGAFSYRTRKHISNILEITDADHQLLMTIQKVIAELTAKLGLLIMVSSGS